MTAYKTKLKNSGLINASQAGKIVACVAKNR
jgi:hypothetical protein